MVGADKGGVVVCGPTEEVVDVPRAKRTKILTLQTEVDAGFISGLSRWLTHGCTRGFTCGLIPGRHVRVLSVWKMRAAGGREVQPEENFALTRWSLTVLPSPGLTLVIIRSFSSFVDAAGCSAAIWFDIYSSGRRIVNRKDFYYFCCTRVGYMRWSGHATRKESDDERSIEACTW